MGLQYLAVGMGRDGTDSLTHVLNDIFRLNGFHAEAVHEHLASERHDLYCLYKETGDEAHLTRLSGLIRDCPYQAVVGQ